MIRILLSFLLALCFVAPATAAELSAPALQKAIAKHITDVPEFKFLREQAAKMGVRVYLFGGTAAGYAHYVKWDELRKKGDTRFQKERFDYDYTNIYHSSQDLDIVVDGNPQQAKELERLLAEKFRHFQGNKTDWELRLLKQDMGDKQALLNNPDFLDQHSDSNSTGMVEITEPEGGDPVVRDIRDWENKTDPHFLKDVRDGKLHYYFSDKHHTTTFFKDGRNPPILSAIRYLTKVFQYGLEPRAEDLKKIKEIIDAFDPKGEEMQNSYVQNWLLKKVNGRKLIRNAQDMEYAVKILDELGLRKKLIAIENNAGVQDSLAWWMNKEPLRSFELGKGEGKTAKELGLDVVAHETKTFVALESITKSPRGIPNVFISRAGFQGEYAAIEDGFYVREGKIGARNTGLTVRFHLDPNAREGKDFVKEGEYIVVKNRAALKVIPESLNFELVDYLRFLQSDQTIHPSDRGLFEKMQRRISARAGILKPTEKKEVMETFRDAMKRGKLFVGEELARIGGVGLDLSVLELWDAINSAPPQFDMLQSTKNLTTLIEAKAKRTEFSKRELARLKIATEEYTKKHGALALSIGEKYYPAALDFTPEEFFRLVLSPSGDEVRSGAYDDLIKRMKEKFASLSPSEEDAIVKLLEKSLAKYEPKEEFLTPANIGIKNTRTALEIWFSAMPETAARHPEIGEKMLKMGGRLLHEILAAKAFTQPELAAWRPLVNKFIEEGEEDAIKDLIKHTFHAPHARKWDDEMKKIAGIKNSPGYAQDLLDLIRNHHPVSIQWKPLVPEMIRNTRLSERPKLEGWLPINDNAEYLRELLSPPDLDTYVAVLAKPKLAISDEEMRDWVKKLLDESKKPLEPKDLNRLFGTHRSARWNDLSAGYLKKYEDLEAARFAMGTVTNNVRVNQLAQTTAAIDQISDPHLLGKISEQVLRDANGINFHTYHEIAEKLAQKDPALAKDWLEKFQNTLGSEHVDKWKPFARAVAASKNDFVLSLLANEILNKFYKKFRGWEDLLPELAKNGDSRTRLIILRDYKKTDSSFKLDQGVWDDTMAEIFSHTDESTLELTAGQARADDTFLRFALEGENEKLLQELRNPEKFLYGIKDKKLIEALKFKDHKERLAFLEKNVGLLRKPASPSACPADFGKLTEIGASP